jgi:hypothetical protein
MFRMGTFESHDPEFNDTTELNNQDREARSINGPLRQWQNDTHIKFRVFNFVFEALTASQRNKFVKEYTDNRGKAIECEVEHLNLTAEFVLSGLKVTTVRDNCSYRIEVTLQCLS